jgi:hypothetical protein
MAEPLTVAAGVGDSFSEYRQEPYRTTATERSINRAQPPALGWTMGERSALPDVTAQVAGPLPQPALVAGVALQESLREFGAHRGVAMHTNL